MLNLYGDIQTLSYIERLDFAEKRIEILNKSIQECKELFNQIEQKLTKLEESHIN